MAIRVRGILAAALVALLLPGLSWAQSSLPWTFHSGATATGNGNVMQADYFSTIHVQLEGTFVGTVVFEGKTKDASGYALVQCTNRTDQSKATEADAPGYWDCPGGAYSFRVRVAAYTSGTIVVTGTGTTAVSSRGGGGTAQGLDPNFDIQNEINGATMARPFIAGNGTQGVDILGDPTLGGVVRPRPLGDTPWRCWTNFNCIIRDEESQTNILVIDPDAFGTGSGTITLQTGEQLVASNLGIEFNESDTNPSCSSGKYNIYADTSETKLKKCQNGTVSDLSASATEGVVRKASDETVNNSTSVQDDNELFIPLDANSTYVFEGLIIYNSSTVADFQIDFTVPSGATGRRNIIHGTSAISSCSTTSINYNGGSITAVASGIGGTGADCDFPIVGTVTTSGTSGNFQVQWAQNTLEASDTVVKAGSYLRWRKL